MESNNIPTLFISYSYQDKEFANRIAEDIKKQRIDVKYDSTLLKSGDTIRETLLKSLREVDIVLVIITPNSISSSNVMNELGIAQESIRNSERKKLFLPPLVFQKISRRCCVLCAGIAARQKHQQHEL
jgi:predicted nucleotide-binding protein